MIGFIYAIICFGVSIPTGDGFHPKSPSKFIPAPHGNTPAGPWAGFADLKNAQKGDTLKGMGRLKQYFRAFGYLDSDNNTNNINMTECYDDQAESAVRLYQQSFGLPITGNLDAGTLSQIAMPRCGVEDIINGTSTMFSGSHGVHGIKHYTFFEGRPKWAAGRHNLTYAFSPENEISRVTRADLRTVFARAFDRWAAAIPVTFRPIEDYGSADIKIGFFSGNHGDQYPFDGALRTLAHAFSPQDGRFHLDAAESWTTNLEEDPSKIAVDLESVATHEIGHILGLGHSGVREAIMYPSIAPRTRKVDLAEDDVRGAQALYGSNPHFRPTLISSATSEQFIEASAAHPLHAHSWILFLFLCLWDSVIASIQIIVHSLYFLTEKLLLGIFEI